VTTSSGAAAATLDPATLSELRDAFGGDVIEPSDARYDDLRGVFNGMFDRRPAAILRPAGQADVIRAIAFARQTGLPLAIRSGGHSVAGFSSSDGGIVIDLRELKGVRVDPDKRTASVQGGVDWGTFDREAQQFGLATTGGRVTSTGVAGFTTGSGSGWLERKLGFASDNVIRAELVTADGEVVVVTENENADLLWGLSGGGGNFGVITELEFRLAPVEPIVYGGLALFDPAQGREMITTWRDIAADAPDELGWGIASVCAPPEEFVPVEWHGKRMWGVLGQFAGAQEEAERILQPLRALKPIVDLFQPMPYTVFQSLIDPANPYGRRNYWRAHNLADLGEGAVDTLLARADAIVSPFTALIVLQLGGAIARAGEDTSAVGGRSAPFAVHLNCMWEGAEGDEANIAWTRDTTDAFSTWIAPGMGLNFFTEVGNHEIEDGFGAKVGRLRALKDRYDPTNLFRLNQNIKPSA
jgi:hypothetical protein